MSVRLGMVIQSTAKSEGRRAGGHQINEMGKKGRDIVRPRAGFGVPLEAECRTVGELDALQAAVK